jgi:integrase
VTGTPYSQRNVARDMKRVLRAAKLPLHFSLHRLRHTYAAQRIAAGENIYYVSRQLGHASTKLTLDTYGRWLPARSTTAPNTGSDRSGDQTVTNTVTSEILSVGQRA